MILQQRLDELPQLTQEDIKILFKNLSKEAKSIFKLIAQNNLIIKSEIIRKTDLGDMVVYRSLIELTSSLMINFKNKGQTHMKEYYLSVNGKQLLSLLKNNQKKEVKNL